MKQLFPFCAFAFFFAAGTMALSAQPPKLDAAEIDLRLEKYIRPYVDQKDFSGVILIAQGDSVLAEKAYGLANLKTNAKNKFETKFRVASVTKTFTAAGIVMLAERGKLKLNDPLGKFFPAFPNGQNITIEQLLLHRSGVGDLDEPVHYKTCYAGIDLVNQIAKAKPEFAPGTDSSYSNSGYSLLAAVIENVSGEPYETFLQKNIFGPLKMTDSGSFCTEPKLRDLATGHVTGSAARSIEQVAASELTQIGAGSAYSTAEDLLKWLKAVRQNRLFNMDKLSYPYGWGKRDYSGSKLIEQSGLVEGFNSYIALYPSEDLYVVFLSNTQSGLFNRVAKDFRAVMLGGDFSTPEVLPKYVVAPTAIATYAGAYRSKDIPVPLNVVIQRDGAYLKWGNYPFMRSLTPIGKDKFFHRAEYAEISFDRDAQGKVIKITWKPSLGDPFSMERADN